MKKCFFCQHKINPDYKDHMNLQKFLTARNRISSSERSGVCANHQRKLSAHIKYARYLALIPYTAYQSDKAQNK